MRLLLSCLLSLFAAALPACLWDYDTLAQESRGKADLKAVIVGGFPRNPPLYYEMRLERVSKLLETSLDDLDAYDAAGVACDRLGRADGAIEWMARKLAAMERMGYDASKLEQPNHRYRYLANLGTFYAHRWFKNGANREAMDDLKQGRELIAQAIKENPNAHFGREKYQLMVMDWVLSRPQMTIDGETGKPSKPLPDPLGLRFNHKFKLSVDENGVLASLGLEDALDGFAGLVSLGAAWESVDVFHQLAVLAQMDGRSSVAHIALQRVYELIAAGKTSIVEGAPTGPALALAIHFKTLAPNDVGMVHEYAYQRGLAEGWQIVRTNYILDKAAYGKHPDTDDRFWNRFPETLDPHRFDDPGVIPAAAQSIEEASRQGFLRGRWEGMLWGAIPVGIILGLPLLALVAVLLVRRRGRKRIARVLSQTHSR